MTHFCLGSFLVLTVCSWASCTSYLQIKTLHNKKFRIAAEAWPPFLIIYCPNGEKKQWTKDCPDGGEQSYDGVLWNLLLLMKQARNSSFTLMQSPDRLWGTCYGITNCTGMVGMVNRGEADFALGSTCST